MCNMAPKGKKSFKKKVSVWANLKSLSYSNGNVFIYKQQLGDKP